MAVACLDNIDCLDHSCLQERLFGCTHTGTVTLSPLAVQISNATVAVHACTVSSSQILIEPKYSVDQEERFDCINSWQHRQVC